MKFRTRSSAILGTLCLVTSLALATASADEPADAPVSQVSASLTEVARAQAPSAGAAGPDDTVWIAERAGTVRTLDDSGLGEPVLDISDETTTDGERGLLGIAFDTTLTHFYISYTDLEGTSTIDEFAVEDGQLQPETRRTVLTQTQPYANHNGGDIKFGPDGYLYIAFGDGGSGGDPDGNGQKLDTLLGKLLRIDPSGGEPYAIPADNPFVDDANARDEIWAYGLRNPWRFSFDAGTGDLLIGDVGQSDWEEIDWPRRTARAARTTAGPPWRVRIPSGAARSPANHVPPVYEYDRTGLGCSVTGGFVYRGDALRDLRGAMCSATTATARCGRSNWRTVR